MRSNEIKLIIYGDQKFGTKLRVDIITFSTQGSYLFENTAIQFNYNMDVLTCVWSAVVPYLRVI